MSKEFNHVSVLTKQRGKGLLTDMTTGISTTQSWVFSLEEAPKVKTVALHDGQKNDPYFGGEVVGFEPAGFDKNGRQRVAFHFKSIPGFHVNNSDLNAWSREQCRVQL